MLATEDKCCYNVDNLARGSSRTRRSKVFENPALGSGKRVSLFLSFESVGREAPSLEGALVFIGGTSLVIIVFPSTYRLL